MSDEKRIFIAVAATIQVPVIPGSDAPPLHSIVQPPGRQIAQACHVANELRFKMAMKDSQRSEAFDTITTIILQARDSSEMGHIYKLLTNKRLNPVLFGDTNEEYGPGEWPTAVAVLASKKQVCGVLDYLPLWGAK